MISMARTDLDICTERGESPRFLEIAERAIDAYAAASANARGPARIDLGGDSRTKCLRAIMQRLASDERGGQS